jgi:oxygen-independent coproporphyrinogen III oxidase
VIRVPPQLLRRYNLPSPRYTSYPTVTDWEGPPGKTQWFEQLGAQLSGGGAHTAASLYMHIPFCQALCTFCGCNMRVARNHALAAPYVTSLLQEYRLWLDGLGRSSLLLGEIYLGGGTPTWLPADELARLLDGILQHAELTKDASLTVEIDPRVTTRTQLAVLRERGFNRLTMGVQDFDPRVQDIVNRVHDEPTVARVVNDARELGFPDLGIELIYGLPLQTADSIRGTIAAVARLQPERVAFYPYASVPWIKPSQRRFTEADLPEGDSRHELFSLGRERLADAGYAEIGLDQYALPASPLLVATGEGRLHRNFMGYSASVTVAVVGLGVSAMSDAGTAMVQNEKSLPGYETRLQANELPTQRGHVLDAEDLRLRQHIYNLLTRFSTRWSDQDAAAPWRQDVMMTRLESLQQDGLILADAQGLLVTELGRPFLRNICMSFDARAHRRTFAPRLVGNNAS